MKIQKEIGKPKAAGCACRTRPGVKAAVEAYLEDKLENAVYRPNKMEEQHAVTALRTDLIAHIKEKFTTGTGAAGAGNNAGTVCCRSWSKNDKLESS